MADRLTEILTKHRNDWTRSVEQMQNGQLRMHENGEDTTEEWTAYLVTKINEIDELLIKHEARNA